MLRIKFVFFNILLRYETWICVYSSRTVAVRHGEEHHVHRDEGLPTGLQILLFGGKELERADALGGGEASH